jgi:hypothetical protein
MKYNGFSKSKYLYLLFFFATSCLVNRNSKVVTNKNTTKAILPVLWIDKSNFHNWAQQHNTKIMFRFTYTGGKITLTGWAPKTNDNDDYYDSTTLPLNSSSEKQRKLVDTRIYLGNLRLSQIDVEDLDSQLTNPSAHYLVFIPILDSTYKQQVAYEVYASTSKLSSGIITSDAKLDPSPPATRK